jgi:nicotinamidase-related amidase
MKLDSKKTAMLTLDLQSGILGMAAGAESVIPNAVKTVEFARKQKYLLIHVGLGFSEGHPEIPDNHPRFKMVKEKGLFVKGTPSAEFHPAVVRPGDLIVHKQRVSAFSENTLQMILRAHGIENLVLFGVATSGITLSTLRRASDLDFQCTVIKDACFDRDEEVHRLKRRWSPRKNLSRRIKIGLRKRDASFGRAFAGNSPSFGRLFNPLPQNAGAPGRLI